MAKRDRAKHQQAFLAGDSSFSKKRSRPLKQHQKEEKLIWTGMSSKILKEALIQQKEIQDEGKNQTKYPFAAISEDPKEALVDSEEEDVDDFDGFSESQSQYNDFNEVDEEERILEAFMSTDIGPQRALADLIISKIKEKDEQVSSGTKMNKGRMIKISSTI